MYWEGGHYTLATVRGFFSRQSNFDRGLLVKDDFKAITGITLEYYEEHKSEIRSLKYTAFQAWIESHTITVNENKDAQNNVNVTA